MSYLFLFPGQGSQKVGMGADLAQKFPAARARFETADRILGRGLSTLCFSGPDEELKSTRNTQPALFTIEAAVSDILAENSVTPSCTAGHSLGEYSALYAAGVFSFEDGLKIVAKRGELMADAGTARPGTMAAVIGLPVDRIAEVLGTVTDGVVVAANQNSPDQTVISGEVAAVGKACELLKAAGAKRALTLPVSGAFHSPLMQDAAERFAAFLEPFSFADPRCPVIANVTATAETGGAVIKGLLVRQLVSPVRWVESVACMKTFDPVTMLETGPGAVLAGLVKKCDAALNVIPCGSAENIYSVTSSR